MGNVPVMGVDPDGEFLIAALFTAVKIIGYAQTAISTFSEGMPLAKAIEQGNWGQAGLNVATFALSGLTSKGVNAIMGNASGIAAELGRAGLNGIASAGLSKLSGGDFSSGFFRGAAGSLAFSGLGKLQGAGNKSSGGNYQGNHPCPKGWNCADLGSITIEAARKAFRILDSALFRRYNKSVD